MNGPSTSSGRTDSKGFSEEYLKTIGAGRTRLSLSVRSLGDGILACIYNENAHIGAVAVAEYDSRENRTSTSVITRLGHKDDAIAQRAAYLITKQTKHPSCVIAGAHLDGITDKEIQQLLENAEVLVKECLENYFKSRSFLAD
ncbi:MAG: hypothetical protein HY667_07115 [Chloroflexi bacterium]|nr:hypothetical protein [Chloroflexota bacterium]